MNDKLKNIDRFYVVEWISESWNEIEHIRLIRSWRKLLDHSGNEFQESREETKNCEIVDLLKTIPGCEELTDCDVGEWVGQDENCELDVYKRQVG